MVTSHLPVQEAQETWVRSWGRETPGGGPGDPLQDSCLESPMDRGAWRATGSHRVGHNGSDLARTQERFNF